MHLIKGDLWDFHDAGFWVCITTNGFVKANGEGVMGRGVAQDCKLRYRDVPRLLGQHIQSKGNTVMPLPQYKILTLPVKHNWWEPADPDLISQSVEGLVSAVDRLKLPKVYLPQPGCGNGVLKWEKVEPILIDRLDDRFTIVRLK